MNKLIEDKLDHFETWYEQEGKDFKNHKEACRIAWENGTYYEREKLSKSIQLFTSGEYTELT